MFQVRIKLPFLSKKNPNFEANKRGVILSAMRGEIPSYCMAMGDESMVELVEVDCEEYKIRWHTDEPPNPSAPAPATCQTQPAATPPASAAPCASRSGRE